MSWHGLGTGKGRDPMSLGHSSAAKNLNSPQIAAEYLEYVGGLLASVDLDALERVVAALREARDRGAGIYVVGNGGSAAAASHFATDLAKLGGAAMRVMSLTDNIPLLTALANDHGYQEVFERQLANLFAPGDVLVAISASGNSPNLIRAVESAKARGGTTVALVGFDGGVLRDAVDHALFVPSEFGRYGPAEDVHLILQHVITSCLAR